MHALGTFVIVLAAISAEPFDLHLTFDEFDPTRFSTPIPNPHTEVRDGVLWTHGGPEQGYPPIVAMPIEGTDVSIDFRYRQLGDGEYVWLLVDGDDGFGGNDHLFRVKLLRDGIQLQIDGHTKDPKHPDIQKFGGPRIDKVSGSYRTNELLPVKDADLGDNDWHSVHVSFSGESVTVTFDESQWSTTVSRPGLKFPKTGLLWLLKGREAGIELDDIRVSPTPADESESSVPR